MDSWSKPAIHRYEVNEAYDAPGVFGVCETGNPKMRIIGSREEAEAEVAKLNDESDLASILAGVALGLMDRVLGRGGRRRK